MMRTVRVTFAERSQNGSQYVRTLTGDGTTRTKPTHPPYPPSTTNAALDETRKTREGGWL